MNFASFAQALEQLTAIPAAQAAQARIVGEGLSDADRKEFLAKLTEANASLTNARGQSLKALDAFDGALLATDRRLRKESRKEAEEAEHAKNLGSAEEQFINLS